MISDATVAQSGNSNASGRIVVLLDFSALVPHGDC